MLEYTPGFPPHWAIKCLDWAIDWAIIGPDCPMIAFGGGCSVGQLLRGIGQSIGQWIGQSKRGIGQCHWAIVLGNNWAIDWAMD